VVAALWLLLGYLHYAPGTAYSLSASAYRTYAFPAFRYSDIIWLYLRDNLATRPLPYVDYPLEYPPLTGVLSYLFSFAPDLPAYFAVTYLVLAGCALGAVVVLHRLPGANPWYLAATPALFFYVGHQWDIAAIFATALALLAFHRGHDRSGATVLTAAVWLKFFPLAFLAAVLIDRFRQRRFRAVAEIGTIFLIGTVVVNVPFAAANVAGWDFFYRWNRDRLADSGIWVLWRTLSTAEATRLSLVAAVLGGLVLGVLALRARGPVLLPVGATFLLWWLFVNKTFTTHLVLWVFLALALLRPPVWLWIATVAVDIAGFQLGNFLNLYNVADYQYAPLIRKAVLYLYDPLQIARSIVLLVAVAWGGRMLLKSGRGASGRWIVWNANGDLRGLGGDAVVHAPGNGHVALPQALVGTMATPTPHRPRERDHAGTARFRWRLGVAPRSLALVGAAAAKRLVWGALVTVAFGAATVVMTWPYAIHLQDTTVVGFDPLLQIWLSRWIQHALVTDPLHLFDANIFFPFAQTLAYTDANIPGALLAAPIDVLTHNAILTNSLLVLATFPLAAGGMYALIVHLTRNRAAGFLAGLAFAFLPFRIVHLWHLNWLEHAWLPWLFLAFLRLIERPSRPRAVVLGLLVAILALTSFYFVVQIGILLGLSLGAALIGDRSIRARPVLVGLGLSAAVTVILVVPLDLPYLQVRGEQGLERTIAEAEHYKATAASYLSLAPWDRPNPLWGELGQRPGENLALTTVGQAPQADGHQHPEIVIEDALFPGGLALVAAAIGLVCWRRRWLTVALALTAVTAAILSLGPSWGPRDGSGVPLPYRFLFDHAPFFTAMRVPARLGGLADFALVTLAGLGVAAAWRWLSPRIAAPRQPRLRLVGGGLTALCAGLVLFELYTGPIPLEAVARGPDVTAPYRWLAAQPDDGAVMEFPAESVFADRGGTSSIRRHVGLSMYWSTTDWKPLVNGNSGFIPAAYSNLLDAFVGDIRRPDGTTARRISHVDPATVGILQQLGVRYLVFHRSQYAAADWPAVAAQLDAAEGAVEKAGDFGEATIYRVHQPIAPPEPSLTVFAPTLMTPRTAWAPEIVVQAPNASPSLLSLTRPATLTTTWYDAGGRKLWRGVAPLPLPTLMKTPTILCSSTGCRDAPGVTFPRDSPAPRPEVEGWRPSALGHYVVKLVIAGDHPLDCTVDLDVVKDADAIHDVSPTDPHRWAKCTETSRYPVNNPGGLAFHAPSPSVTFVGNRVALQTSLTSREDEEIQAWFLLAPPGSSKPWQEVVYQSPTLQRLVQAGEPAEFDWLEQLTPAVPPGVYDMTIWFHRRVGASWEHAYGGGFHLAPVVVDADGSLRWAGPYRLAIAGPLPRFQLGAWSEVDVSVTGDTKTPDCQTAWRLLSLDGRTVVASGEGGTCERVPIRVPTTVPPGRYTLEITALAVRGATQRVSDAVRRPLTVTDASRDQPS
jgi:hypothetical protein